MPHFFSLARWQQATRLAACFLAASVLTPWLALAQPTVLTGPAGSGSFGSGVTVLPNNNYIITDPSFDQGGVQDVGAVYLYNGTTNTLISSLTGSTTNDRVGFSITVLPNGNYLVLSSSWNGGRGAVTWCNGSTGINGVVSAANSLTGAAANDRVGNVTVLATGNYVVSSLSWNGSQGAATWCSGSTSTAGVVSVANSLTGSTANDQVGYTIKALANGNYVVGSRYWNGGRGAATWGNGSTGTTGVVSDANSIIGSSIYDQVSVDGITALTNGNYVVNSHLWGSARGAATWGNGSAGVSGVVSDANSLTGAAANEQLGINGSTALTNGNYVVATPYWNSGRGAVTWSDGSTGLVGVISAANSLTGSTSNDNVGSTITALTNGNYVVGSSAWNGKQGAATWANGNTGLVGVVSTANSLTGSAANDGVGSPITALTNGNYVVVSYGWNGNRGAATWANGSTGLVGVVSAANSLTGSAANDRVGSTITALTNGNYVVGSNRGTATWSNGSTSTVGVVSAANSLTGAGNSITALTNGNYVVATPSWNDNRGAATWGNGSTGTVGVVSAANSLTGANANDRVSSGYLFSTSITALPDGNYVVGSLYWNGGRDAVTLCDGSTSTTGQVTACNSIVGSVPNVVGAITFDYRASTKTLIGGLFRENKVQVGSGPPSAPTGATRQSFGPGATVASLAATGQGVQWYAAATGGSALPGTTPLADGSTYYASQTVGGCESTTRLAVTVAVTATTLVVSTGTAASPVLIGAGTYSDITVTSTGVGQLGGAVVVTGSLVVNGTLLTACQSLSGPGSFTLAAGGTLGICDPAGISASGATGAVQLTGTRSFDTDASYVYNGTAAQSTGSGLPATVRNLTTTNSADLTLTSPTNTTQVVTVAGSGNLVLDGNALTLLSSASGTALLVNSGTGVVSGATGAMQRYIDASGNAGASGYRHYAAPVSGMAFGSLATTGTGGSFTPVLNSAYNTAANTLAVAPYPTVYGYDQSRVGSPTLATNLSAFDQGYVSPITTTLAVGQGYTVQVGNTEKITFTGTFTTGTQAIGGLANNGTTAGGWQLLGNPYPAPLDWRTVGDAGSGLSNVDAAAYVFQSTNAYTGRYTSFTNGVGAGSGLLAAGQAFFVHASAATAPGTVTLTNANRVVSYASQAAFQRTAETRPLVRLSLGLGTAPATVAKAQDETFVYFEAGATAAFDGKFDAYKLSNPNGYYLGSAEQVAAGAPALGLSISGRAPLTAPTPVGGLDEVPLWLSVPGGTYTLTATELLNFAGMGGGTGVWLRDAQVGTLTNLATTPSYSFSVGANAAAAGRFSLVFRNAAALATAGSAALAGAQASLSPNPTEHAVVTLAVTGLPAEARQVDAELVDVLGRPVGQASLVVGQGAGRATVPVAGLAAGVYALRLRVLGAQGQVVGTLPAQRLSVR